MEKEPEKVTKTIDLKPGSCPKSSSTQFAEMPVSVDLRQVVELPDMPPEITQYNIYTCKCGHCGKHVRADVPKEAERGFGPRLIAIDPSRSHEAFKRIFGNFSGTLTTDRHGAYNDHKGDKQTCLAHIKRDFEKVSERPEIDGSCGRILQEQLGLIFGFWAEFKKGFIVNSTVPCFLKEETKNKFDSAGDCPLCAKAWN